MSLPSSSRKIIVEPHGPFRWMLGSGKGRLIGNSGPCLVLTVQANGPHGGVFQMHLVSRAYVEMDEYNQEHGTHKATLRPKDVKRAIEYALKMGWDPNDKKQKGAPFKLAGPLELGEYDLP